VSTAVTFVTLAALPATGLLSGPRNVGVMGRSARLVRYEAMKSINIYAGRDGWFYEVWTAGRVLVIGWARTRDRAELEAAIA
jgi:hypothetical protein